VRCYAQRRRLVAVNARKDDSPILCFSKMQGRLKRGRCRHELTGRHFDKRTETVCPEIVIPSFLTLVLLSICVGKLCMFIVRNLANFPFLRLKTKGSAKIAFKLCREPGVRKYVITFFHGSSQLFRFKRLFPKV